MIIITPPPITSTMQSTDVRIFWTCRKPSKKEVKVCEQLITKAAEDKDMVIAVIRQIVF